MKLLPTPQSYIQSDNIAPLQGFSCVKCEVAQDKTISWGISQLEGKLTIPFANGGTLTLAEKEDAFFAEKNATEQGYILIRNNADVTIYAKSSVGFLYGLMTLRQLAGDAPATIEIKDRPSIRFRGCKNTFWAESGVWSYDFGDGLVAACERLRKAIDQAARAKLNMMYVDGFGFRCGDRRFPGYNETMQTLSEYALVRGIRFMTGGYAMGYGQSAFSDKAFQGRVFRNRYSYPDGELYDCTGTFSPFVLKMKGVEDVTGRSYGTCLSNQQLTDDKISEIYEYIKNTGCRMIYFHSMDAEEIYPPLWLARCKHCREKYPSDDLFAKDGMAGAFADFYDRILTALKPEFPDVILCAVSPGYGDRKSADDDNIFVCRKFWAAVLRYMEHADGLIPTFRELLLQHNNSALRFDLLDEVLPSYGCIFFASGDGFYTDQIYTPISAYTKALHHSDVMIYANGSALQKPTQYTNAEYGWNPDGSAYWLPEFPDTYEKMAVQFDDLRLGTLRPAEIYGEEGLLETACAHLFGEKHAKEIADVFRIRGKNGECPIFTACNAELWTNYNRKDFPMLWDTPVEKEKQMQFYERFSESAQATDRANEMLIRLLLQPELGADTRAYLEDLQEGSSVCLQLCSLLTRYMDLYIQADAILTSGVQVDDDLFARCDALIRDADQTLAHIQKASGQPFDPLGGIRVRRDEIADMVSYSTGQIIKSLHTGQRVPEDRRPLQVKNWW